jgi:hypothetical protein
VDEEKTGDSWYGENSILGESSKVDSVVPNEGNSPFADIEEYAKNVNETNEESVVVDGLERSSDYDTKTVGTAAAGQGEEEGTMTTENKIAPGSEYYVSEDAQEDVDGGWDDSDW